MPLPLIVLAPVTGTVQAMADVPDPVFAGEIVGPGLAIDPSREGVVEAIAPVAGKILKLHPHAFVIVADGTRGVLVHLGLDTVQLDGAGFTLHVAEGDTVAAGDVVVSWNPAEIESGGRSPVCPIVALEGKPGSVVGLVEPGADVRAGEPLLEWA
ncbi:PTS sugar transporter subunit IIA [Pengzhenrongella frigida]|uniref:PTS glucose transporter subunit IIA n=1 Tax=Pengzhenrongella frigida TaxID=1259133 RepID=A0A4V1ZHK6_9MICO|nr:PTS glucose transporter subunit IIA [Cellulomonas sp. HLT2-17]RYV52374.1 PTS glucose transporter subunit IIA [Cellulomonas sp. HLT2-17]